MRLLVLEGEKFTCHSCTRCCRGWHVELAPDEAARIGSLKWPDADPLHGAKVLDRLRGRPVIAHRANGDCVFLNASNGLCRIHEQFGASRKPLGCRLFPFHIAPTFEGHASVTARMDCPSVVRNEGDPHTSQRGELEQLARELKPGKGFDLQTMCGLERRHVELIIEFLTTMLRTVPDPRGRALFLALFCDWLSEQSIAGPDREDLGEAYSLVRQQTEAALADQPRPPNAVIRMALRSLLALYLRRDEDLLSRRASRLRRVAASGAIAAGLGDLRQLGADHPPAPLRKAKLFHRPPTPTPEVCEPLWRLIGVKLASFQFMGAANQGRDLLVGLRSVAMLYPLTVAAARCVAAGADRDVIRRDDMDFAIQAIDHSFGRSDVLRWSYVRSLENFLLRRDVYTRMVLTL